jgi:hypothetical protein
MWWYCVTITSAQIVDDVVINAIPEDPKKGSILKYRLISIVSLLLLAGIIIPSVILTRKPQNDLSSKALLDNLKSLLSNTSLQELELPTSVPSLAIDWLFHRSNFNAYSFDRHVQRYAVASFFFSIGGGWKENQGWLTEDETLYV